jgi:hypothetical protein
MTALLLGSFVAIACGTWWFQNRGDRIGGRISGIKAGWLAYAIVLWIGVPLVLCGEGTGFMALLVSMLVRAVVEIPLCLTARWRVAYGVAHDLIHVILVIGFWSSLGIWAWPTVVSLITELIFVYWFVKATGGPAKGVFFVPGDAAHRRINCCTAVIFVPQLVWFVFLLFHP